MQVILHFNELQGCSVCKPTLCEGTIAVAAKVFREVRVMKMETEDHGDVYIFLDCYLPAFLPTAPNSGKVNTSPASKTFTEPTVIKQQTTVVKSVPGSCFVPTD
jgi:hypothetical protein